MNIFDWGQLLAFFALLPLLAWPLGRYMARVYQGQRTWPGVLLRPVEAALYRCCGIDPDEDMGWKRYALALLCFNLICFLTLFALLLLQGRLPMHLLNPLSAPGFTWDAALNAAMSFVTNTNWQNYSGETQAAYLTQMLGFTVHNFLSAATGMAVAVALIRGFARRETPAIGNFWADLTRSVLYILLPLALLAAVGLASQGVIQNLDDYRAVRLLEPVPMEQAATPPPAPEALPAAAPAPARSTDQTLLPMGPVASQEAIKLLGTNGGGFFNANSTHPFENPTPLSHWMSILCILLIPCAFPVAFGVMVGHTRQGAALLGVMLTLLLLGFAALHAAELHGNPLLPALSGPNMEGKELRFGAAATHLFTVAATGTSTGAVACMHESLLPLGGLVPLVLMLLGEVTPGGVGSGLYNLLAFAIIAVFVAGLMIGRTPEYLGKKMEVREMWMAVVMVLTAGILVLLGSALGLLLPAALDALGASGAQGLSESLYAFASMGNNNGSAFAGLNADSVYYNPAGALAMFCGRYVPAVAALCLAGSLAAKKYIPPSVGTLPTHRPAFAVWLLLVIVLVGALTFFPALALGPLAEHFALFGAAGGM